ncbi:hypothetical protein GW17_00018662 [Ensete ventricosum]|nr:hypothetical protein GW17_00018662 [Ensete ventricosum]
MTMNLKKRSHVVNYDEDLTTVDFESDVNLAEKEVVVLSITWQHVTKKEQPLVESGCDVKWGDGSRCYGRGLSWERWVTNGGKRPKEAENIAAGEEEDAAVKRQ